MVPPNRTAPSSGVTASRASTQINPRRGICRVRFIVAPTVVPGPQDMRELGTHFRAFDYVAP